MNTNSENPNLLSFPGSVLINYNQPKNVGINPEKIKNVFVYLELAKSTSNKNNTKSSNSGNRPEQVYEGFNDNMDFNAEMTGGFSFKNPFQKTEIGRLVLFYTLNNNNSAKTPIYKQVYKINKKPSTNAVENSSNENEPNLDKNIYNAIAENFNSEPKLLKQTANISANVQSRLRNTQGELNTKKGELTQKQNELEAVKKEFEKNVVELETTKKQLIQKNNELETTKTEFNTFKNTITNSITEFFNTFNKKDKIFGWGDSLKPEYSNKVKEINELLKKQQVKPQQVKPQQVKTQQVKPQAQAQAQPKVRPQGQVIQPQVLPSGGKRRKVTKRKTSK
jgi:hypothetical protein